MLAQQTCVGLLAIPNSGSVHENCFCAHILLRFRNRKPGEKSMLQWQSRILLFGVVWPTTKICLTASCSSVLRVLKLCLIHGTCETRPVLQLFWLFAPNCRLRQLLEIIGVTLKVLSRNTDDREMSLPKRHLRNWALSFSRSALRQSFTACRPSEPL